MSIDLIPTVKLDPTPIPPSDVAGILRSVTQDVTPNTKLTPAQELLEKVLGKVNDGASPAEWALASHVWDAYSRAKRNKDAASVTLRIEMAMRARKGEYESDEIKLMGGSNTVWWPITNRLCNTAYAFLSNLLLKTEESLWDVSPTPVPTIPDDARETAIAALTRQFSDAYTAALQQGAMPMSAKEQFELVKQAKKLILDEVSKAAQEGLDEVKGIMSDRFAEARWKQTLDMFLNDFVTFPSAIVCGPESAIAPRLEWARTGFKVRDAIKQQYRIVHPIDFFPSTDSVDCQTGSFVIEARRLSRAQLSSCLSMTGFLKDRVQACLDSFSNSNRDWLSGGLYANNVTASGSGSLDNHRTVIDHLGGRMNSRWEDDEEIKCLTYYGKLPGKMLLDMGIEDKSIMDGLTYDAEVWTIGKYVIRALVNPSPLGLRPYYHAVYSRVPGSFWGEAIPQLAREFQRICNSLIRGIANNIGYATHPVHEINTNRLADGVVLKCVTPGQIIHTIDAIGHGGDSQAIKSIKFDMHAPALTHQLLTISAETETALGLPRFLSGDNSAAGRNLGIFTALQNNVSVTLGRALVNIDNMLVIPLTEASYYAALDEMDMMGQKIPPLDAQIVAKGSTVILERENSKAGLSEFIQLMQPAVQAGIMPPDPLSQAYVELAKRMGFGELMPAKDEVAAYIQNLLKNGQMSFGGGSAGGISGITKSGSTGALIPPTQTDGRSPTPEIPLG